MMKKTITLILALAATACGTENTSSTKDIEVAPVETINEAAFKMYDQARFTPESFCDLHTVLKLFNTETGIAASLQNSLDGICELAVFPNVRTYSLEKVGQSCGSDLYVGRLIGIVEHAAPTIEITDHRNRICRDIVPATVIVKQIFSESLSAPIFSYDFGGVPLLGLDGTLTQIMAIGGETTGFALMLTNGNLIELDFATPALRAAFVEDNRVNILGNYKTVRGVEIPVRQVFVVESMTAI